MQPNEKLFPPTGKIALTTRRFATGPEESPAEATAAMLVGSAGHAMADCVLSLYGKTI
ncbi:MULTISPECIES: hypothetical protein [Caballeronia]|jgi:hypothetical protein|uniref:Uncharacterized protein n=2 Tax=Caballeronia TaxID=1827195 RepID=A0ACB5QR94_9BURK|nr:MULTISPECIES: hypothetical protein [Caballeronia]GJH12643.1 hypothetical protein CBA19CS11_27415 [Caballeronia novacaledonica]GJH17212.1 hypothetical protein CBA19CS22_11740 [Caballeronia novacaledonica]